MAHLPPHAGHLPEQQDTSRALPRANETGRHYTLQDQALPPSPQCTDSRFRHQNPLPPLPQSELVLTPMVFSHRVHPANAGAHADLVDLQDCLQTCLTPLDSLSSDSAHILLWTLILVAPPCAVPPNQTRTPLIGQLQVPVTTTAHCRTSTSSRALGATAHFFNIPPHGRSSSLAFLLTGNPPHWRSSSTTKTGARPSVGRPPPLSQHRTAMAA